MIEVSKKVNLYWVKNTNAFLAANPDMKIQEATRTIGSARGAVTTMLANGEEQRTIMRHILGVDPYSQTSNWDAIVKNYWNSLSIHVPPEGKVLEIGFTYDIKTLDKDQKDYIEQLREDKENIKTTGDLSQYVVDNVEEKYKYRYGLPINGEDYMLWRYCLGYGYVANTLAEVDKAPKKIKFYLFSEQEKKTEAKLKHDLKKEGIKVYLEVIKDKKLMDGILIMEGAGLELNTLTTIEKEQRIDTLSMQSPNKFLKYAKDKTLVTKAEIEQLVNGGILRRLPNTEMLVDANNIEEVIGNSLDEAVIFFKDQKNKAIVSEYMTIYKHNKKE